MVGYALFTQNGAWESFDYYLYELKQEINAKSKDYILNVNVEEWKRYFIEKYDYTPLTIYPDKVTTKFKGKPMKKGTSTVDEDSYIFEIRVPFIGWFHLFSLQPKNSILSDLWVDTPATDSGDITSSIIIHGHDEAAIERHRAKFLHVLNGNIPEINNDLKTFKAQVEKKFEAEYNIRKEKILSENTFFEKLNIKIEPTTDKIYKVPVLEKKKIPEPVVDGKTTKKFTETPTLPDEHYYDILDVINTFYKSVEKKPSTYKTKDEEGLRDYVLPVLETRYSNTTVTGETFNKGGKTDILIRHTDGTNLFVAECKFWKGEKVLHETINQLFDRYLTWRDSKTAILFFVTTKEPSKVLRTIQDSIVTHPYYIRENGNRGESSFSYVFHFPTDKGKHVFMEVMTFHFPTT
ncbi:MAG: hypothetical protein V4651_13170 [Bacteroidota bacterium]